MALYPEYTDISWSVPFTENFEFKTLISNFDDKGQEKRRRKWLYPKRSTTLVYNYISQTEARTLWQFYMARYGSYESFNFFYKDADVYVDEYVATGDGSTTTFDLPGKNTSSREVQLNGNVQGEAVSGSDYSFSESGGEDGADQIDFTVVPDEGDRITVSFSGILKIRCRFAEDNLSFNEFYKQLKSSGIQLKGLLSDE